VVDRALAFDMDRRYPDALTMQGDVRALREQRPPPYASGAHRRGGLAQPERRSARRLSGLSTGFLCRPWRGGMPRRDRRRRGGVTAGARPHDVRRDAHAVERCPAVVAVAMNVEQRAKTREKWVLVIMAGAICLALMIGLVQWLVHGSRSGSACCDVGGPGDADVRE